MLSILVSQTYMVLPLYVQAIKIEYDYNIIIAVFNGNETRPFLM